MHQAMDHLTKRCRDLRKKEAQVRLELRRNGGHGGKIGNTVLLWLQDAGSIQNRFNDLKIQQNGISCCNFFAHRKVRKNVVKLTHEIDCLLENASTLLVFNDRNGVDRITATGDLPSRPLVGKMAQEISNKIWKYLMGPTVGKIGLYGFGGAGKTTIMKNINNQLTNAEIFDKIIWVTLSGIMSFKDLLADIGIQLGLKLSINEDSKVWAAGISGALRKLKTCLLIFDDMWNPVLLEEIGIPEPTEENGCKLVLTTRFESVCDQMYVDEKIHVRALSENEAWDLFISRAGVQVLDAGIKTVAEKVVHECLGLPITIITVAHAMREEVTLDSWREASRDLLGTGGIEMQPVDRITTTGDLPSRPLVGKWAQEISNKIWKYLMSPTVGKIGLYGSGGAGKTTIMKNINNQLTNAEIFDKIIWVTVPGIVNLKNLQADFGIQLGLKLSINEDSRVWAAGISGALRKLKTCLLIFDDMWNPVLLEEIGIPEPTEENGCKLVLTTRFERVCDQMYVKEKIYVVSALSKNEAWDLFVSRSGGQVLRAGIAKKVVDECDRNPITIIRVAQAMQNVVTFDSVREALRDLVRIDNIEMQHVLSLLRFGYRRLKNERVQKCFLCCGFFPEDHKFEPNELIKYWIAEDFIHTEGNILASINEGHEILKELKDANMLEIFMEDNTEWLKMHDLFRDSAIRIMAEDHGFLTKAGMGINDFPHILEYKLAKKISLFRNRIDRLNNVSMCPNLSTLLLSHNPLSYISSSFFYKTPNLQVLDMSYSGISHLPPSLSHLSKLRVLVLQYCTGLKDVLSLENFKELHTLNLRGTLVKKLPQGIKGLVNLRSLDLSETVMLQHIQQGVFSSLSNLQELQMQGSRLCQMESPMIANCFKEIRCLEQLAILTLSGVGFEDHLDMILHLQRYKLKVFFINVYGSALDYIDDM